MSGKGGHVDGAGAVRAAYGVTTRQLDHWVRAGYVRPRGGAGSGEWRTFPEHERRIVELIAKLSRAGLTVAAAAAAARTIANHERSAYGRKRAKRGAVVQLARGVLLHVEGES